MHQPRATLTKSVHSFQWTLAFTLEKIRTSVGTDRLSVYTEPAGSVPLWHRFPNCTLWDPFQLRSSVNDWIRSKLIQIRWRTITTLISRQIVR